MRQKKFTFTLLITFILSFLLQGINDPNVFIVSNWRLNNIVNILHFWITFLTTYYLFSFFLELGFRKLPINTSNRLIGLLLVTQCIAFLWVIVTDILFYILYYKIDSLSETTFYEFDIPLALVVLTIGSIYFYQKKHLRPIKAKTAESDNQPKTPKRLEAYYKAKNFLVQHSHIGIIYLSNKMVWIKTLDGQVLHSNESLAKLSNELSSSDFFRLNRQVIISKKIITGYSRLDYQKLEVLVDDVFHSDLNLVVSKYNAPNFKKWLTNSA